MALARDFEMFTLHPNLIKALAESRPLVWRLLNNVLNQCKSCWHVSREFHHFPDIHLTLNWFLYCAETPALLTDWNIKEGTRTIAQYPDINAASKKNV